MVEARLTLTVPEGVWIGDVSRSHPEAEFRVLAAVAGEETGTGLVELTADDVPAVIADVESADDVSDVAVLDHDEDRTLLQFETTVPLLLMPMQGSGTPLELPFTLVDGRAEWTVTAPRERLSALGDQLREFDIPFDVEYVRRTLESTSLLTQRQEDLVRAAVDAGYYDTPRECSLTELAEDLDMAKSTASETLHRAEGTILKAFVTDETSVSAEPPAQ